MLRKSRWKGALIYGAYLAILAMIWSGVKSMSMPTTTGLVLALLIGAVMAVFWPRW